MFFRGSINQREEWDGMRKDPPFYFVTLKKWFSFYPEKEEDSNNHSPEKKNLDDQKLIKMKCQFIIPAGSDLPTISRSTCSSSRFAGSYNLPILPGLPAMFEFDHLYILFSFCLYLFFIFSKLHYNDALFFFLYLHFLKSKGAKDILKFDFMR